MTTRKTSRKRQPSVSQPVPRNRATASAALTRRKRRLQFVPWRMSGRTAIIAVILSVLALSYAYPVRTYLEQLNEIDDLEESQEQQSERIEALTNERGRWNDPEYVKTQARDRLLLVEPGEELIIIIDDPEGAAADAGIKPPPPPPDPWYEDLWDTFNEADKLGK